MELVNYHTLAAIMEDITLQSQRSPAFAYFNKQKILNFHSKNKVRIEIFQQKAQELLNFYVQKDKNGKFIMTIVGNAQQYLFHDAEAKATFTERYNEFCKQEFHIEI